MSTTMSTNADNARSAVVGPMDIARALLVGLEEMALLILTTTKRRPSGTGRESCLIEASHLKRAIIPGLKKSCVAPQRQIQQIRLIVPFRSATLPEKSERVLETVFPCSISNLRCSSNASKRKSGNGSPGVRISSFVGSFSLSP